PAVAVAYSTSQPPGPEEVVTTQITAARIREALDSLPPDYRTAVILADLEGLSYKEIAEAMDSPIGTVMSRIYRGRKILHKLLYDHALEIGVVEDGDPPPGERETKYTRIKKRGRKADAGDDAVDLAAY